MMEISFASLLDYASHKRLMDELSKMGENQLCSGLLKVIAANSLTLLSVADQTSLLSWAAY